MANRSYLCCSAFRRTYPSFANPRYRPERDTIATARYTVPLLWLALFRPTDLHTDKLFDADGDDVGSPAPLASKRDALARLATNVPRLERALPALGSLTARADQLAQALRGSKGRFVTIELDEIATMERDPARYYARVRRALAYLAGSPTKGVAKLLASLCEITPKRPLTVLGTSHIQAVPWEVARPVAPRKESPVAALHAALERGDQREARALIAAGADVNARGHGTVTAMQFVLWKRVPLAFARELLDAGYDLGKRHGGYNALHAAIWIDDGKLVRAMIELGADARAKDGFGRPPLALAAFAGARRSIDALIRHGVTGSDLDLALRTVTKRLAQPERFIGDFAKEAPKLEAAVAQLTVARGRAV